MNEPLHVGCYEDDDELSPMPDTNCCAECGTPLPAYWPKGLCAQCALDGALEMTHAASQILQREATAMKASLQPPQFTGESSPLGSFGDYDLLDEIARGGMGVVYKARQRKLGRIVAVKMILAGPLAGKEFVQRFRTESAAAAILQHPNIVAIHDVGVHEGRHYFSMDYVEGQSLSQLVGRQPLPANKAACYVELIAEAIHYAHERGILHRDLKPSNVLIDSNDQPRITDFGLARRLDGESSLTMTGQVLGSPNFMPPEQAGVKGGKVGRPSDVYALGGILYYLLTARAPFQADSLEHTISQVLNAEPVSPRLLNPSIPRDLETITLKCLEKEPSRRYQTAAALAEELGRFLRNEPILARPISATGRTIRWARRKPAVAALSIAVLLLALVLMVGAPLVAVYQAKLRTEAEMAVKAHGPNGAEMLLRKRDAADVLSTLERAVRRFPEHPRLWSVKGLMLEQNGRIEEAIQDFTRAIELGEAGTDVPVSELNEALLNRSRLFKKLDRLPEAGVDYCRTKDIPIRDPRAPPTLIDLSLFYDAPLTESIHYWKGRPGNDLAEVPRGLTNFASVEFDARGIISLNGTGLPEWFPLPQAVTNIPVRLKFAQLHCFMGTGWWEDHGARIGTFVLHYADGQKEELAIRYAIHVRDCIAQAERADDDNPLEHAVVAWTGDNFFARSLSGHVRLYKATWENPRPEVEVRSIDFISTMTRCAPFLIAMTAEP